MCLRDWTSSQQCYLKKQGGGSQKENAGWHTPLTVIAQKELNPAENLTAFQVLKCNRQRKAAHHTPSPSPSILLVLIIKSELFAMTHYN